MGVQVRRVSRESGVQGGCVDRKGSCVWEEEGGEERREVRGREGEEGGGKERGLFGEAVQGVV